VKKSEPKAKANTKEADNATVLPSLVPVQLQQLLLDIFRYTFAEVLNSDDLQPLLQDVKAALYDRDFARAFGKPEYLEAYSSRWSPSRALCYVSILVDLRTELLELSLLSTVQPDGSPKGKSDRSDAITSYCKPNLNVVSFGGGAAEVVAFGGYLKCLHDLSRTVKDNVAVESLSNLSVTDIEPKIDLLLIDTAQWGDVVGMLDEGLTTPPHLSKYASKLAREANTPLISVGAIATTFRSVDLLELGQSQLDDIVGREPTLLTLLFTLNELYSTSMGRTTTFLLNLTSSTKPGTLLLVVDSPGSYSETVVGNEEKRYPMQWLLDHTLLSTEKTRGQESLVNWTKIFSDDSRWFRLPDNLRYLIPLENTRYQISLYRRL
jgi:25S rRNA (uracil2843-N3)-methyltransferase